MKTCPLFLLILACFCTAVRGDDLQHFGEELSKFYTAPAEARFDRFQTEADRLADRLRSKESGVELNTAVFIARVSEKYAWPITGKSRIATLAREIAAGKTKLAKYVRDDTTVDPQKLDIWWADFFATGEDRYLARLLSRARYPQPGERAANFLVPAMAAWSFKSNCVQHPAVMKFAKTALVKNTFPQKTAFLKECTGLAGELGPSASSASTNGKGSPPRMTKIVTRRLGQKAGSFADQPTVSYLAGKKYGRLEEAWDRDQGIHGLLITNEPDAWMINLADRTGRHIIDPGPTFEMHAPIIWSADGASKLEESFKGLEYGHEANFFREHHAREMGSRVVEGRNCQALELEKGAITITLLLDPKSGRPFQIDETRNGKHFLSIRYLSYETDLPFRQSLFEPPAGIKLTEAR